MKKLSIFILTLLFAAAPAVSNAQGVGGTPVAGPQTAEQVVAFVKESTPSDRKRLVEEAIQANPDIAATLISLLIAEFPTEAADYTTTVVSAVIALPEASRTTEQKAAILTSVAQAAVPAALLIPAARVDSVVQAVNAVKAALETVTASSPEFSAAVGSYVAQLVEGEQIILNTPEGQETVIVSGDSLVSS